MTDYFNLAKRTAVAALVILLVATGFYLLGRHAYFFLLVFAGILLAVLFCGITDWFTSKVRLNRGVALTLAVLLFFGFIVAVIWLVAPTIGRQVQEMRQTVPQALEQIESWLNQYGWGRKILDEVPDNLNQMLPKQETLLTRVSGVFSTTLSFLADFLIVLVTALFFAASPKLYTHGFTKLFPVQQRNRILEVMNICYETLKTWLVAMLVAMLATGIVSAIGYKLIGLPLAYALALLAFFGEFVQNIGPALAGVPAVLVGLTQSTQMALYTLILYCTVQLIQSYIVTPLIFQKSVNMPPALLLFFQVLLGILQGGLGLVLAAPILAVLIVVVNELYVKDFLEKHSRHKSAAATTASAASSRIPPPTT